MVKLIEGVNADRRGGKLRLRTSATASPSSGSGASEADFLKRFRGAIAGQPTLQNIYTRLSGEHNLPFLRENTRNLSEATLAIPEQERTAGKQFGISTSRMGKRITGRLSDIQPSLQRAVGQEQVAQQGVQTGMQLESAQQAKELRPFTTEASMISERLAREMTQYTTDKQSETNQLIAKWQQQGSLDDIEARQLADLAVQEDRYAREKDQLAYKDSLKDSGGYTSDYDFGNDWETFGENTSSNYGGMSYNYGGMSS